METCPKCGASSGTDPEEKGWFTCGSHYELIGPTGEGGQEFVREDDCYKNQLAQQSNLLWRAVEVMRHYTDVYYQRSDSSLKVTATKAQALIQLLEELLEKTLPYVRLNPALSYNIQEALKKTQ
jgi:hypothetical protein